MRRRSRRRMWPSSGTIWRRTDACWYPSADAMEGERIGISKGILLGGENFSISAWQLRSAPSGAPQRHPPADTPPLGWARARPARGGRPRRSALEPGGAQCSWDRLRRMGEGRWGAHGGKASGKAVLGKLGGSRSGAFTQPVATVSGAIIEVAP
jgi:hypothetical protein